MTKNKMDRNSEENLGRSKTSDTIIVALSLSFLYDDYFFFYLYSFPRLQFNLNYQQNVDGPLARLRGEQRDQHEKIETRIKNVE